MVAKTRRKAGSESGRNSVSAPAKSPRNPGPGRMPPDPLRWSVERRLAFVEERLFWRGEVNRTDLVRRFGVSMSQASADIARYLAHDPPGVIYDKSAKRYAAQPDFRPLLAKPNATRFLGELRLVEVGILAVDDTMLGVVPPFDTTPVPERRIDPLVL